MVSPVVRSALARLRRLPQDRSGGAAILVTLLLPVMTGVGLLGVDAGTWYYKKRDLQTAVDAAALAAAFALANGESLGAITAAARRDALRNGFDGAAGTLAVEVPPTAGPGAGNAAAARVVLRQPMPMFYARIVTDDTATVSVAASALTGSAGSFCILGLDPTLDRAVEVSGNGLVNMSCGIAVNSTSASALFVGGSGTLNATTANVTGAMRTVGGPDITWTEADPLLGRPPVRDPFADTPIPTPGACDEDGLSVKPKDEITLEPEASGVMTLCDGLEVRGDLHLEPGTYVIDGGEVRVNSGARLTGDNVTLVLTGQGSDYATLRINGGAEVRLTAPTSGALQDMVIVQDPAAPDGGGSGPVNNILNGSGSLDVQGVVYFPNQAVTVNGTGDAVGTCMTVVARKVSFGGTSDTQNTCPGRTVPQAIATRVTLIQ